MKAQQDREEYLTLEELSQEVRGYLYENQQDCLEKVKDALKRYPDAPQPQNLLGILAEIREDKVLAMKHYRAAWALAPYYRPSRKNIDRVVDMHYHRHYYFCDEDVDEIENEKKNQRLKILWRKLG